MSTPAGHVGADNASFLAQPMRPSGPFLGTPRNMARPPPHSAAAGRPRAARAPGKPDETQYCRHILLCASSSQQKRPGSAPVKQLSPCGGFSVLNIEFAFAKNGSGLRRDSTYGPAEHQVRLDPPKPQQPRPLDSVFSRRFIRLSYRSASGRTLEGLRDRWRLPAGQYRA